MTPGRSAATLATPCCHLVADLGRVGRTCAEDDLQGRVDLRDGIDEVDDALLPRDSADEEQERAARIYAVTRQHVGSGHGAVFVEVDAVVDDMHPRRIDIEQAQHVGLRLARDRHDGVGLPDRGALHPGRQVIGVAELLHLPGPQRLERVDRQDARHAPELRGDHAAHIGVPRVTMDEVGVERVLRHGERTREGVDGADEARIGAPLRLLPLWIAPDCEAPFAGLLIAEAANLDVDALGEGSGEVFDMYPGAAVDEGRIFLR